MKKFILFLLLSICVSNYTYSKPKWYKQNSRVEVVNEKTVILKNVVKIDITTNDENQITYVYDLIHSKLVKVARGSFTVNVPHGNYLIQSDKKITKTLYKVIIE